MSRKRYQKMYTILCYASSEAIDLINAGELEAAANKLQRGMDEAEEYYLAQGTVQEKLYPLVRFFSCIWDWLVRKRQEIFLTLVILAMIFGAFFWGVIHGAVFGFLG